jgi:hypothetical protein
MRIVVSQSIACKLNQLPGNSQMPSGGGGIYVCNNYFCKLDWIVILNDIVRFIVDGSLKYLVYVSPAHYYFQFNSFMHFWGNFANILALCCSRVFLIFFGFFL